MGAEMRKRQGEARNRADPTAPECMELRGGCYVRGVLSKKQRELAAGFFLTAKRLARVKFSQTRGPGNGVDQEDLESAAMLGLVKAAGSFDPKKGVFKTYADRMIRWEMQSELRKLDRETRGDRKKIKAGLLQPRVFITASRFEKSYVDGESRITAAIDAQEVVKRFPLLGRVFLEGKRQAEISREDGVSSMATYFRIKKKMVQARRFMGG